jgi:hypothetical protein
MTDKKKPAPVTHGELYAICSSIYLLIAAALLGVIRDDQNVLRVAGYFILFGVAVASSITFTILGIRERRRRTRGESDPAERDSAAERPLLP